MGKTNFELLEVAGLYPAMTGMRAPLKSYDKNDTSIIDWNNSQGASIFIGENDYDLAKKLCKAGSEHRKWMRQVQVWLKITGPIYWWSEADTYSIGVSKNSESTMHTLLKQNLTIEDFDTEHMSYGIIEALHNTIDNLNEGINYYRNNHNFYKEDPLGIQEKEKTFISIKSMLPSCFLQTRYVNLNYETLHNIYQQRHNHRLPQWHKFCDFIETELPYSEFITEKFLDN